MNAAAYLFSLAAARLLIPAEFGAVTALLSILQMGIVASLGLQATAARRIAVAPDARDETVGVVLRSTVLVSAAVGGAVVLATPLLSWVLHFDSWLPLLLCAATLAPLTAGGGFMGIAQGSEQWRTVTVLALAFGFGRLVAGTLALVIHPSVTSAMIGVALGAWLPVIVGLRSVGLHHRGSEERTPLLREALVGTHTLFAFYVLVNLDALIARNRLDAHDAGLYAAGVIITKTAIMAPSFVGVLLYPRLATDDTAKSLRLGMSIVAGAGFVGTAATALLPHVALQFAGGPRYAEIAPNLWMFAMAGSVWAVVQVLVLDSLARRRKGVVVLTWVAAAALPLLVLITNVGLTGLILLVGMIGAALVAALTLAPDGREVASPGLDTTR